VAQAAEALSMFVLDTNIISELRKPRPHGGVSTWIAQQKPDEIAIAAVTAGEIQAGIEKTRRTDSEKAAELETWLDGLVKAIRVIPADDAIFRIWARLMVKRQVELSNDALIAATALHHGLTVATRNVADFTPFGVLVANPFGRAR
jgi:predicted nucleic acid-binding protein